MTPNPSGDDAPCTQLYNLESERIVIGHILRWPECFDEMAKFLVAPETFYRAGNRAIYKTVSRFQTEERDYDAGIIADDLAKQGMAQQAGGIEYLLSCLEVAPELPTIGCEHAAILRKFERKRRASILQAQIKAKIESGMELNGEAEELAVVVSEIDGAKAGKTNDPIPASQLISMIASEIDYVMEPIAAIDCLTILQGRAKHGKSCFALMCAMCISAGRSIHQFHVKKPRKVLYLSFEDPPRRLKDRIRRYAAGARMEVPDGLFIWDAPEVNFDSVAGLRAFKNMVIALGIEVVVVDTFSYMHVRDENSASEMRPVMHNIRRLLRTHRLAVVLIHHTRKPQSSGPDQASSSERGRGSSVIAAAADIIIDWGERVEKNCTKCSIIGKDLDAPVETVIRYAESKDVDDAIEWFIYDPAESPEQQDFLKRVFDAVEALVKTKPNGVSAGDIERSGHVASSNTVKSYLKELEKKGRIKGHIGPRNARLYVPYTIFEAENRPVNGND